MFAPLNYCYATTFDEIAARIYDYADDEYLALAHVQVSPWYLDPNRMQTASGEHKFFKGPFEIWLLFYSLFFVSSMHSYI